VTGWWLQKAGVFGIRPNDSSLKIALDEMPVALALLARAMKTVGLSFPCLLLTLSMFMDAINRML
jgi:hypothetical protein